MAELRCVAPVGDLCGEGLTWAAGEGCLYWVDINRFLVRRLEPDGAVRSWMFDEPAVALSLTDRPGTLVVALASRLILWTPERDDRQPLGPVLADWPQARFNDGGADPRGRLVIGTMGNNVGPEGEGLPVAPGLGALFSFEPESGFTRHIQGVGIANTIAWSPDLRTFYSADTLANEISAYAWDAGTGGLGPARRFLAGFERGAPDGSAVDAEGFLWNARYGGGCVVRVAPDGGIDRVLEIPCDNVTTCAFGGPGLGTLFVTTARGGTTKPERLAGSVFAIEVPVPGLPERVFRTG